MEVDLIEVGRKRPLIGVLGAIRIVPDIVNRVLHGELPQRPPEHLRLRDTTKFPLGEGGWVLLGERPRDEIALGRVGKFWRPVIDFATVTAERFRDFAEPGYAKTIYSLAVRPLGERRRMGCSMWRGRWQKHEPTSRGPNNSTRPMTSTG